LIAKDPTSVENVFGTGFAVSYELLSDNLVEIKIREGVKFFEPT